MLIQAYLDQAVADGAIPPLDTRLATLAWLGAINEVVIESFRANDVGLLTRSAPELTLMLLRSIGASVSR